MRTYIYPLISFVLAAVAFYAIVVNVQQIGCVAQETIVVPSISVESVSDFECDICVERKGLFSKFRNRRDNINRNLTTTSSIEEYSIQRPVMETVLIKKPITETYLEVTRKRRVGRKPIRSFFRRIFCR